MILCRAAGRYGCGVRLVERVLVSDLKLTVFSQFSLFKTFPLFTSFEFFLLVS